MNINELHPTIRPVTDHDFKCLGVLVGLLADSESTAALEWYAQRSAKAAADMQLRAQVHTPDGVKDFYLNEGRRQGVYDMLTIIQAYRQAKARSDMDDSVINKQEKNENYGY